MGRRLEPARDCSAHEGLCRGYIGIMERKWELPFRVWGFGFRDSNPKSPITQIMGSRFYIPYTCIAR